MKFLHFSVIPLFAFLIYSCGTPETKFSKPVCYKWEVDSAKFDFAKYVDPMIGTGGHGHTFPGACAPFGMVQLSPDTRVDGSWDGCSGYHYDDSIIYGFSHTHLSGTGCSDYGDILFMPGVKNYDDTNQFRSKFSHANEKSEAGYYSVVLDNSLTKVELTASPRVGVHRYTFNNDDKNLILLDLTRRDEVIDSKVEILNNHAIQGYRFSKAWANNQRVYFYAEFSRDFLGEMILTTAEDNQNRKEMSGKHVRAIFPFTCCKTNPLVLKVALSAVSCENAKQNMMEEVPDFDFDAVHRKVVQQWNDELGKIEVKTTDETQKKIFYTALYHCFIAPNLYCDVNGDYRGRDDSIHNDTIHPQYTVFSLWDTYRALNPLFTIVQQKRTSDFINTFVKQAQEGGMLPVWELSANETNCMIGYHSIPVIVDAWMKGIKDFDTATAYEAMKNSAIQGTNGLDAYKKFGFIPAEGESESVSKTLEYAYDDWCIALAAKRMKNDADYNYYMRRSQSWRNLFDSKTGFFRPRLNNSFVEPFDPNEVNFHYTEANAWQYSLAVQQDVPGLINEFGGDKKFIAHLDSLFSHSSKTSGRDQADISGMIGQYAQGNEPSHHMAYLYDYTSEPWKTQEIVSRICNEMYTDKPDGLCGNEDCGQMSAWYVLSSIGFYQVTPGTTYFALGSPQFSQVKIHLENGKTFTINASNAGIDAPYVSADNMIIALDTTGTFYYNFKIGYSKITSGTTLNFTMLKNPDMNYQNQTHTDNFCIAFDLRIDTTKYSVNNYLSIGDDPHSFGLYPSIPETYVPTVPIVTYGGEVMNEINHFAGTSRTFYRLMSMKLESNDQAEIFTSLNNKPFVKYNVELEIEETSSIRAFAKSKVGICSDTIEFKYFKIPEGRSIKLNTEYANQYSAGGNNALIDGIRGSENFRTGDWQGYEGKDLDAVVDLGSEKNISHISIGFLQDQGAWIFMPDEVTFYSSSDGKNFTEIGKNKNTILQNHDGPILHDFYIDTNAKARYIKVVARNIGTCPSWHPGKGSPAWIFSDEIIIH
jgi:predicted alpha-1,2-mannosidase